MILLRFVNWVCKYSQLDDDVSMLFTACLCCQQVAKRSVSADKIQCFDLDGV